ncbi:MAG: hypothetical protein LUI61_07260 [Firmicutes bacterium]|nr:hypothetical protein [Bacillota bacterium]
MDTEYLKRVISYAAVSVAALAVIIYFGYHIVNKLGSEVKTEAAYIDTFVEEATFDGYIMRDETVLYSSASGTLNYLVSDGAKVAVGTELADVYRSGSSSLRDRIDELDEKIAALTEAESSAEYSSVSDVNRIDTRIVSTLSEIRSAASKKSAASVYSLASELLSDMNLRGLVTGEVESYAEEIAALTAERDALAAEMTNIAETIVSDSSAYYFYAVDGYESAFSFDDIDSLTVDDISAMTETSEDELTGYEAGKLVNDYIWYLAVSTDTDMAVCFTEGAEYDVSFDYDGATVTMELYSILTDQTGAAYLIFSTDLMPDGFSYTRYQPVTICVASYSGYRVPETAVRVVDYDGVDVTGVYILYGGTVYFRRIEIILSQDGYVLCDTTAGVSDEAVDDTDEDAETEAYEAVDYLELYDAVIVSSTSLYDGKILSY